MYENVAPRPGKGGSLVNVEERALSDASLKPPARKARESVHKGDLAALLWEEPEREMAKAPRTEKVFAVVLFRYDAPKPGVRLYEGEVITTPQLVGLRYRDRVEFDPEHVLAVHKVPPLEKPTSPESLKGENETA